MLSAHSTALASPGSIGSVQSIYKQRTSCRACGAATLTRFLSLGSTPLANSFLSSPEDFAKEPYLPLEVFFCEECSLVQLTHVVDPALLFRNYIYVTGTSDTIAKHNIQYAAELANLLALSPTDLVIEVASNDGSLLSCFQQYGVRTLGVEPAENIANVARSRGVETVREFFGTRTAVDIRKSYGPAKLVIANNVLAHVDDPRDFLAGCRELVSEDGLIVIEAPYLPELLDGLEYDTIYHEHLCYFSAGALLRIYDEAGLAVRCIERVSVHGGSLRIYAARAEESKSHSESVLALVEAERQMGLMRIDPYLRFARNVERNRAALLDLLSDAKMRGKVVAGYGAPAKGNTLLNYCGIGTSLLPYTVDRNPMKVGLYTPGMHIPVREVSVLLESVPDYVLVLAWNFAAEIMRQQQAYAALGGRFILPLPEPRIV